MGVFAVSGLWHAGLGYGVGWTFLIWGALNGLYQWVGLIVRPIGRWAREHLPRLSASAPVRVLQVLFTFHLIAITWVFFRASSVSEALLVLQKIWTGISRMPALITLYPFGTEHYVAIGLIALLLAVEILDERRSIWARLAAAPEALRWSVYYVGIFALLILGRWQQREFIYMQF